MSAPSGGPSADTDPVAELVVDPTFNGPVGWANGGYACGVIATAFGRDRPAGTALEVMLRRPVPLAAPLRLVRTRGGDGQLWHADQLLAEVAPVTTEFSPPPVRPGRVDAERARGAHPGWPVDGPLAHCFVCSSRRPDGLHVTAGPLPGHPDVTATPFEPSQCTTEIASNGVVAPEFLWAVLDCPSFPAAAMLTGRICLLGTFTVYTRRDIRSTESLVVVGWLREQQRRVYRTASALIDTAGDVVAGAHATWIELKDQPAVAR